ncbi:hypothetical protein [Mesorhizobium sp.]|uniref:hypothetical protein n=1 Tax=Mesorhizobium sp. TaxID=1871066 RepID=UPI003BABD110
MSMFSWSEIALDIEGAKLEIKQREQKIEELQTNLSKAETALAQAEEKAPDTAKLASDIDDAMKEAGIKVDQNTVKTIAAKSLKPLKTYFDSTEWNLTKPPAPSSGDFKTSNPGVFKDDVGPGGSTSPSTLPPNSTPMVQPNSPSFTPMVQPNNN